MRPGPNNRTVLTEDGKLEVPSDWALLPPGDAGLTRRVKAAWPTWTVKEKKGRRTFSRGVWAPAERIERIAEELAAERSTEQYARRRATQVKRREKQQEEYVEDFHDAILQFLKFDAAHGDLAGRLAKAVTEHATPVGSGTVARTQRIPISQRAESAVIAWMRHQTTAYDDMSIPSVRGQRREVRRKLAERSRRLLERYRDANAVIDQNCPLRRALE